HRNGEALLAHHEDGHAFLAQGIVHMIGRVEADPGDALGLGDSREAVSRFDLHGGVLPAPLVPRQGGPVKTRVSCRIARMSPITEDRKKLEIVTEIPDKAMVIFAHPDDAEIGSGGVIAKWVAAG